MNELEQQVLADLVRRVTQLEALLLAVAPPPAEGDDDLDDLDPEERAQVQAARRRLANETGEQVEQGLERGRAPVAYDTEGGTVVRFPTSDEELRETRQRFAEQVLKLEGEPLVTAYGKAGPLWLYAYDRNFVMELPAPIKRVMVEDAMNDSQNEAYDMGRDLFKVRQPEGPALTMEALIGDGSTTAS